jgi:hypothetical protein
MVKQRPRTAALTEAAAALLAACAAAAVVLPATANGMAAWEHSSAAAPTCGSTPPPPPLAGCPAALQVNCGDALSHCASFPCASCETCMLQNGVALSKAGCTSAEEVAFCSKVAPPPPSTDCDLCLQKLCAFEKSSQSQCLACVVTNAVALQMANCTAAQETHYCGTQPTPPPPVPPTPPPSSTCVDWYYCDADDDHPNACPLEQTIIAGHQCEGCPRGAGGNYTDATPEALCIAIDTSGNSTLRAGHDNLIPRDQRPFGDWGCIFNSGPQNCDAKGGNCNNRVCGDARSSPSCFKEFRAVQKVGATPVRWILSAQGYEVPPGAVHIGVCGTVKIV